MFSGGCPSVQNIFQGCIISLELLSMRFNVQNMSSPRIDRLKPNMTSLIIEARVTSYEVFMNLCLEDNSFRAFSSEVIPFI